MVLGIKLGFYLLEVCTNAVLLNHRNNLLQRTLGTLNLLKKYESIKDFCNPYFFASFLFYNVLSI